MKHKIYRECVPCEIQAEPAERVEHRACNKVAQSDGSIMTDETNVWFPLRIKKPAMEAAVDWRVNILAADYI
jgi:hypothetical protein